MVMDIMKNKCDCDTWKNIPQCYQTKIHMYPDTKEIHTFINIPSHLFHIYFPGLPVCKALCYKEENARFLTPRLIEKEIQTCYHGPIL